MRITKIFILLALPLLLSLFAFPGVATTVTGQYRNASGTRSYNLYLPDGLTPASGLVVVLHGCLMTPEDMEKGIGLDPLADQSKFAVLYPRQTTTDNPMSCWNWFDPESQQRDTGEASILVGMTRLVLSNYQLNASKVVITGLSAGAAMASNMLGCYSDVYLGGLLASGLTFAAAQDEYSAYLDGQYGSTNPTAQLADQAWRCSPKRSRLMPIVVIQGSLDQYVAAINADQTESFFRELNSKIYTTSGGSSADITKTKTQLPPSTTAGYPSLESDTNFAGTTVVRKIFVQGMQHGWSGGVQGGGQYMMVNGPDASQILVDQFLKTDTRKKVQLTREFFCERIARIRRSARNRSQRRWNEESTDLARSDRGPRLFCRYV